MAAVAQLCANRGHVPAGAFRAASNLGVGRGRFAQQLEPDKRPPPLLGRSAGALDDRLAQDRFALTAKAVPSAFVGDPVVRLRSGHGSDQ